MAWARQCPSTAIVVVFPHPSVPFCMHTPPSIPDPSLRPDRHLARNGQRLLEQGALWPLAPVAAAVGLAAWGKAWAFAVGLRQRQRAPVPVIAVGNIIAGGSGKTPLVAWIRDHCLAQGAQPAVVSRGYGGDDQGNDEAAMLGSATYCNPQRIIAARQAAAEGASVVILDDAYQHQHCHRDLNLLCVDATRPWGWPGQRRGAMLPWGLMREPAHAMRRADAVIATRCDQAPAQLLQHLRHCCRHWQLPLLCSRHAPQSLRPLGSPSQQQPLATLQGERVMACSAIARPQAFIRTLEQLGAVVVGAESFPDHHSFQPSDMARVSQRAATRAAQVICTAKDAVKLAPLLARQPSAVTWSAVDIALSFNADDEHALSMMIHQVLEEHSP